MLRVRKINSPQQGKSPCRYHEASDSLGSVLWGPLRDHCFGSIWIVSPSLPHSFSYWSLNVVYGMKPCTTGWLVLNTSWVKAGSWLAPFTAFHAQALLIFRTKYLTEQLQERVHFGSWLRDYWPTLPGKADQQETGGHTVSGRKQMTPSRPTPSDSLLQAGPHSQMVHNLPK